MDTKEFREYVTSSLSALSQAHALRPLPPSTQPYANEYEASFQNDTTVVTFEGINYGFGVNVRLASTSADQMAFRSYDFDDLLAIRAPGFRRVEPGPHATNEIQRRQIDAYVAALDEFAADVLGGDFAVFPLLARAIQERMNRYDRETEKVSAETERVSSKPWWKFWQ
jgi:hypothetical protein